MKSASCLPKEYCNLSFDREITSWDEAIPLGNGETGCLIWGKSSALRFSLDRGDIWDKTPSKAVLAEDFTFENLVRLAKARNVEKIRSPLFLPHSYQAARRKADLRFW